MTISDMNTPDGNGQTALMIALENKQFDKAKELLQQTDIDVYATDNGGHTALYYAVSSGHLELTDMLLAKGLDIHETSAVGETLLHCAVRSGHLDMVHHLIQTHRLDLNVLSLTHGTPLFYATSRDEIEIARYLLNAGADVSIDLRGETPAMVALKNKRLGFARELARSGKKNETSTDHSETKPSEDKTPQNPKQPDIPSRLETASGYSLHTTLDKAQRLCDKPLDKVLGQHLTGIEKIN